MESRGIVHSRTTPIEWASRFASHQNKLFRRVIFVEFHQVIFLELKLAMPAIRTRKDKVVPWKTILAGGKQLMLMEDTQILSQKPRCQNETGNRS